MSNEERKRKETKLRLKRKGQRQNSVEGKKEIKMFKGTLRGRNVNYEERKERWDVAKRQEGDRSRYIKRLLVFEKA